MEHDLVVTYIDSSELRVDCERGLAKELQDYFTFKVPGHKYMPAFRKRKWDGRIRLYNIYTQTIYAGLLDHIIQFAKDRKYTISVPDRNKIAITDKHIIDYLSKKIKPFAGGQPITAHYHQVDAVRHGIANSRCLLLSPTGSGKSLIIYSMLRYYSEQINPEKKILIIVPTTSLVAQMYNDFKEYSTLNGWDAEKLCHCITGGVDKNTNKKVVISTWQSIYKLPQEYFDQFECVFGDECHLFKADSLKGIMTKLKKCPYRIGLTGTLDGSLTHKLVIEGLFGPVYKVTTTKDLIDKDLLSQLKINNILLQHNETCRKAMVRAKYQDEIDWIVQNPKRNEFISNLSLNITGNTLILFQFVEKHGEVLYNLIKEKTKDSGRPVFFVHGGTELQAREEIRKITEQESEAIIVASYGTFSTGISIRRLHNIIFASPSKSRIRVLQSIGRQLRKSKHKEVAKLYDIGDDISWLSYKNHTLRHFEERLKIYHSEKFQFKINKINLD
jgi:superfamily II DNA or RNA helicase